MNKERDLKIRSKSFAHFCIKIAISLPNSDLGRHLRRQLIRCATSTAANYRAASLGQSKKSFISKLSISIEEADECIFWLEFIKDENLLQGNKLEKAIIEAKELTAIFIASRKTAEKTLNRG